MVDWYDFNPVAIDTVDDILKEKEKEGENMGEIDKIEEKFLKQNNTREFTTTTPEGNKITGLTLISHDRHHGSLLITSVNNYPTHQIIRGFPKIKYFTENVNTDTLNAIPGYEKLDGTCIGYYILKDQKGNFLEFVPKSRQQPVADKLFLDLLSKCELRLLNEKKDKIIKSKINIIFFELFGVLNQHTIPHTRTNIDVRLNGASREGMMISNMSLNFLSDVIQVPLPRKIVQIQQRYWTGEYEVEIYPSIFNNPRTVVKTSFEEAICAVNEHLDYCNNLNKTEKGVPYYEGVVLQLTYEPDIENKYLKVKPKSFMDFAGIGELSVPLSEIRKEINKYLRENYSMLMEEYDEKEVILEVKTALLEEFQENDVNNERVQRAIVKELHKYIDMVFDTTVNGVVEEVISHFGGCNVVDVPEMMRYFGNNYGYLKHHSGEVYFVLSKRVERGY